MSEFERLNVLVVAAPTYERRVLQDLLRNLGARNVTAADTAITGFGLLVSRTPDVMIADVELRPQSGLQLTREVRAGPAGVRRTPIVLYTAELSPVFADSAEAAGVTELLPKPASLQDLRDCLTRALLGGAPGQKLADRIAGAASERKSYPVLKRADWTRPQPKLERAARAAVALALEEARIASLAWSNSGEGEPLAALREALRRASREAGDADECLRRALQGVLRLADGAKPNGALLDAGIAAVRALLASSDSPAMREALADALNEAAIKRG